MKAFPFKVRFGQSVETEWRDSTNNIQLHMIDYPRGNFRARCVEMMLATWADEPQLAESLDETRVMREFLKILSGKTLPNSLESLGFQFCVEGLTLIEVTHLLRHRTFRSIHAQCSADRFLQKDSCFIPSSIISSKFAERYTELTEACKKLYTEMIDSGEISILDARYILTRNHRYFYYFGCDLKTAIGFIHQRKCTAIQPEMDNIIAHKMLREICAVIPELSDIVSLQCDERCVFVKSNPEDSSRVYQPDTSHKKAIEKLHGSDSERLKSGYYLYSKKRSEMGVHFNPQDDV